MFEDKKREEHGETAIEAELKRAGFRRLDYEMQAAALRFIKEGATRQEYISAWDSAVASLPAPVKRAAGRQEGSVNTPRPVISRPFTEEQVKKRVAEIKEKKAKRDRQIKEKVEVIKAKILLWDKQKSSTNTSWGDVWDYEWDAMARDGSMIWAFREVTGHRPNPDMPLQVRQIMTPEQFERASNLAREAA